MASFTIRPLSPAIGAVVDGINVGEAQPDAAIAALRAALLRHHVIFFENQAITPRQQRDFSARFGLLHSHPVYPPLPDVPEVMVLDNHPGNPTHNDNWHSDTTFLPEPPMGALLHAYDIPPSGGDTIWANMEMAAAALSAPLRAFLAGLSAEHSFMRAFPPNWTVSKNAGSEKYEKAVRENPPEIHPVIRTHPETGADILNVNYGFTTKIKGLRGNESRMLLQFLHAHMQKPEFQVRWRWKKGDIAFWDNRSTQHYAVNDYLPHRRIMHRTLLKGDRPFYDAARAAALVAAFKQAA